MSIAGLLDTTAGAQRGFGEPLRRHDAADTLHDKVGARGVVDLGSRDTAGGEVAHDERLAGDQVRGSWHLR